MKINDKILSLPPYLSTSWKNIQALQMKDGNLLITLAQGDIVTIPNLSQEAIQSIFQAHATYLDMEQEEHSKPFLRSPLEGFNSKTFGFSLGDTESLGSLMSHNPQQKDAPELPPEVLEKISTLSKIFGAEEISAIPAPEANCHCLYCQIARAMHGNEKTSAELIEIEEEIHADELKFREWDVVQSGDKLYAVTNSIDPTEKYTVYLGEPVGCTCGQTGCQHIVAVLKS